MADPTEPFGCGVLVRPDGAEVSWEVSGTAGGRPAVYLNGRPGSELVVVVTEGHGGEQTMALTKAAIDRFATHATLARLAK
ncbi:MAG: hypothetical protein FWF28_04905 [Micrococcales bacterium]|nr:hypothetical protein [Micrococcales bacterium]